MLSLDSGYLCDDSWMQLLVVPGCTVLSRIITVLLSLFIDEIMESMADSIALISGRRFSSTGVGTQTMAKSQFSGMNPKLLPT